MPWVLERYQAVLFSLQILLLPITTMVGLYEGHPFSTYAKFSEKLTFLPP